MNYCLICKKKLKLYQILTSKCKCGKLYCNNHLHDHACTHDFKGTHQSHLQNNLQVIEFKKINVI